MVRKYFPGEKLSAPAKETHSRAIRENFGTLVRELEQSLDDMDPARYAQTCRERSRALNLYIDQTKPWSIAKRLKEDPAAREELTEVMYALLEGIRWLATAFLPLLPFKMQEVFSQLNVSVPSEKGGLRELQWGKQSFCPGEPKPMYPRIETKD